MGKIRIVLSLPTLFRKSGENVMKLFGFEVELLMLNCFIREVLGWNIPGVTPEFFDRMVEVISDPFDTPEQAGAQIAERIQELQRRGVRFSPLASLPEHPPFSFEQVTGDSDYYRWVYNRVTNPDVFHFVGVHLNISDNTWDEADLVHRANLLRCFNWLFILLTANSPFKDGRPFGGLSRRCLEYPNRYDVPFWETPEAFKEWIASEKKTGRIYPTKDRCWMPCIPRFGPDGKLARLELRSLESGTNVSVELMVACAQLATRILEHGPNQLPISDIRHLHANDMAVAQQGRHATIYFDGQHRPALEIARHCCQGIPFLEQVLADGSPAEIALRNYQPT